MIQPSFVGRARPRNHLSLKPETHVGGCQNYGPFLGVHIKEDIDIDVDIDTDS